MIVNKHKIEPGANLNHANLNGANLNHANLNGASLRQANLGHTNLSSANLIDANLKYSNLMGANLNCANLVGAQLNCANLVGAQLVGADLNGADLNGANLNGANLNDANLNGANLNRVSLHGAYLHGVKMDPTEIQRRQIAPETGAFDFYKKTRGCGSFAVIVRLRAHANAKRVGGLIGRKIRVSRAKVVSITSIDGSEAFPEATSLRDRTFVYRVGHWVEPCEPFDDEPRVECGSGIHGFLTRIEAEDYES